MAKGSSPPAQRLLSSLRQSGPQSPATLMEKLGVSQPTLYRAARAECERVYALGARRNRKLAAAREVRNLGSSFPVFMVDPQGDIQPVGKILAFQPGGFGFVLDQAPTSPRYFSTLPAFLNDARPMGFLGDAFARRHSDLGLPLRCADWSPEDTLVALVRRGEDLPGNVLIGEESFARYQARQNQQAPVVADANLADFYVSSAKAAEEGDAEGPLVGGTQPKFTAVIEDHRGNPKSVIVKFSPAGDSFQAKRWRDLLVCEWLALELLRDAGITTVDGRIIEAGGRFFLEIERFDRVSGHGRRRVLSFAALGALPLGKKESWHGFAAQLAREDKISGDDFATIRILDCFSRQIGNSDRSIDNITFLSTPGEARASLAPVYDIVPMQFAPTPSGQDGDGVFAKPIIESTLLSTWRDTLPLARRYWQIVREDPRLSRELKKVADQALQVLELE